MSWSFSVKGENSQEAFSKFEEELWKNGQYVPFKMGDDINKAAASLAQNVLSQEADGTLQHGGVCLASSGHFNAEGDGNVSVTLHVLPPAPPMGLDA